ncbi:DUF1778 domain-containing protein [Phycicoccus sp. CSK15P-2]|uniref:type II toxin-antitoxin system TacA family antitoxin n=1 Tax=Phycicoccus sp. CSK15P-2 TaxID=2807627 RepID=UPI0019523D01|nr:DUF1778 domain-containing protein [Phycicoccus sp. CSK15P-2]MBM6404613.1 DUF1778 domain-containing protein [Phycicoccus sp. CSK15P-2]
MSTKTERLNLRCSKVTAMTLREAAGLQDQDLTSFVLGAALDRARTVLVEDRALRLTPQEMLQLEKVLDEDATVVPQLAALIRGVRTAACSHAPSANATASPRVR